jgi:predicted SAM-dependent methyltransferase
LLKFIFFKYFDRQSLIYKISQELKFFLFKFINIKNYIFLKKRINYYRINNSNVRIHFGAGSGKAGEANVTLLEGFLNSDILGEVPIDIRKKLPFKNKEVDLIFSSHVIEHITHKQFLLFLNECYRIMKKDAVKIIATPSLEKISKTLYFGSKIKKKVIYKFHSGKIYGKPLTPAFVINGMCHINYGHKFLYDYETIKNCCDNAGFSNTRKYNIEDLDDGYIKNYLASKGKGFNAETEIYYIKK